MRLRDILVHLDATQRAETRLRLAADLARRHGAHLTGLHVIDIELPVVFSGEAGGAAVLVDLLEEMRRDASDSASKAEAAFRERLRLDGIAGEWRSVEGVAREQVALHARYADLVVVGQDEPAAERRSGSEIVEHVLFASGRPVLVVPSAGRFEAVGHRALVGWNASREAARAVNDALPLLAQAEAVTVLAVNPRRGDGGHRAPTSPSVKGGGGVYRRAGEKMYRWGEAWSSTRGRGGLADQPASTAASGSRPRRRRLALRR